MDALFIQAELIDLANFCTHGKHISQTHRKVQSYILFYMELSDIQIQVYTTAIGIYFLCILKIICFYYYKVILFK